MNNKSKKLFASDLDGTLLTTDKKLSPKTEAALKAFVEAGNHFAINTGRDINNARNMYAKLGLELPGSFCIGYNGGEIYDIDKGVSIYRTGIKIEIVRGIYEIADRLSLHLQAYNDRFVLSPVINECIAFYRRNNRTPDIIADDIFEFLDVDPCKLLAIDLYDPDKLEAFRAEVTEKYGKIVKCAYSNEFYLEIMPIESGKGESMMRLAEYLGIPAENVIAAGDEENDISMIEKAGLGVAMINGTEKVKKAADVVTAYDNDHDGLAEILIKYC